jgi:NADH-quinone oxidoreductase subunit E
MSTGQPLPIPRTEAGSRVPKWRESADLARHAEEVPDAALTPVPEALRAEIEDLMSRYPDPKSASIPALAAAQRLHGWVSPEAFRQVACVMRLTPAYLVAVASFYDMLDTEPKGTRRVYVCTNISCSLRGGRELLGKLQDAVGDAADVQVRGFECLGACDIAPMASVDGVFVGPIDDDEVGELAKQIVDGSDPLPEKQLIRRPAAASQPSHEPAAPLREGSGTEGST